MFPAPLTFTPVGTVHCDFRYRFETARQGVFAENCGFIELFPGHNYEQALEDLGGIQLENERDKRYYDLIRHLRSVLNALPENKPFGNEKDEPGAPEEKAATSAP